MNRFIQTIMAPVRYLRACIAYRRAVNMAEEYHAKDNNRYYVICGSGRTLNVITREHFRKLKRRGFINDKATVSTLEKRAFYYTAYPNGQGAMTPEDEKARRTICINWLKR